MLGLDSEALHSDTAVVNMHLMVSNCSESVLLILYNTVGKCLQVHYCGVHEAQDMTRMAC